MKRYSVILLSLISTIIASCYYDVQEELHPELINAVCDTSNITYSATVSAILASNCTGCHNSSNASGSVILDNYNGVRTVALNGKLTGSIDHLSGYSPMPKNTAQLNSCDRTKIRLWVENGATDN
jgi:hypothetical protein